MTATPVSTLQFEKIGSFFGAIKWFTKRFGYHPNLPETHRELRLVKAVEVLGLEKVKDILFKYRDLVNSPSAYDIITRDINWLEENFE